MWARVELRLRNAVRAAFAVLGAPRVWAALLLLATICVAGQLAWSATGDASRASRFSASWACIGIGVLLLADAVAAIARRLEGSPGDPARTTPSTVRLDANLLFRAAQATAALALLASTLARTSFEVRLAEGEEFAAESSQIVARDPSRALSRAPGALRFAVERVLPGSSMGPGAEAPRAVIRTGGGERVQAGPHRPVWLGKGDYLVPVEAGWALRYEIAPRLGANVVESAFVKLQLHPPGSVDSFRLAAAPYRVSLALAPEQPPLARGPALQVDVYRWKLAIAEGLLALGEPLAFEGLEIRFPESRHWATFRVVSDPGLPVAAAAVLLAAAGAALLAWRRLRSRVA